MTQNLNTGIISPLLAPKTIEVPMQQQLLNSTSSIAINIAMGEKLISPHRGYVQAPDLESIVVGSRRRK